MCSPCTISTPPQVCEFDRLAALCKRQPSKSRARSDQPTLTRMGNSMPAAHANAGAGEASHHLGYYFVARLPPDAPRYTSNSFAPSVGQRVLLRSTRCLECCAASGATALVKQVRKASGATPSRRGFMSGLLMMLRQNSESSLQPAGCLLAIMLQASRSHSGSGVSSTLWPSTREARRRARFAPSA